MSASLRTTVSPAADLNTAEAALIGYAVGSRDVPVRAVAGVGGGAPPGRGWWSGWLALAGRLGGRAGEIHARPHPASLELLLPLAVVGEDESCFHTQNGGGLLKELKEHSLSRMILGG
ncbi:uncharacterized protein RBU33_018158 isoform 2-T5 [Hipposideros larvatus]